MVNIDGIPENWNVIPIEKDGKRPVIKWSEYFKKRYPRKKLEEHDGNIAVICGKVSGKTSEKDSGLLILDPDMKGNKKKHFLKIWKSFKEAHPDLAETHIVETPNGFHIYYYLDDCTVNRSPQKNMIYIHSKKENKDIFKGLVKTKFANYLTGFDILGNNGYALIPPSKIGEKEYNDFNELDIKTITKEDYVKVRDFFLLEHPKQMRQPFIDILNGVFEIESYAIETNNIDAEHIYWKSLFREAYHVCGLDPEDLYQFLEANQPAFDKKKTENQLRNDYHAYKGFYTDRKSGKKIAIKPLGKSSMNKYFPTYSNKQITHVVNFSHDTNGFDKKEILNDLEKYNGDLTTATLKNILLLIPDSLDYVLERKEIFNVIRNKTHLTLSEIKELYLDVLKSVKGTNEHSNSSYNSDSEDDMYLTFGESGTAEAFTVGESQTERFEFNRCEIELDDIGIWRSTEFNGNITRDIILDGTLELVNKAKYYGEELYSIRHEGTMIHTLTKSQILRKLDNYIYEGLKGKDIVKRTLHYLGRKMKTLQLKTILGFDNGWVLPFKEFEDKFLIYLATQDQKEVYERIKHSVDSYTTEQEELIRNDLKRLLQLTEMDSVKLQIIIGWCMSALFRMEFLHYYKLHPSLILDGERQSGKSAISRLFGVDFFHAWKKEFTGSSISRLSRLEDYLSSGVFILMVDEFESVSPEVIDTLKAIHTGSPEYRRKIDVFSSIIKEMVAPILICTNFCPKAFLDPALNSKVIMLGFNDNDKLKDNQEWIDLSNALSEKKLFTFLFNYTKSWTRKDVINRIIDLEENISEKQIQLIQDDSRLKKKLIPILFGIELFKDVFGINLEEICGDKRDKIAELLKESLRSIATPLLETFIEFCDIAKDYDSSNKEIKFHKCLNSRLYKSKTNQFCFTKANLRDFNEFNQRSKFNLKSLGNLLLEALVDKTILSSDSTQKIKGEDGIFKPRRCIKFDPKLLIDPVSYTMRELIEADLIAPEEYSGLDLVWYHIKRIFSSKTIYSNIAKDLLIESIEQKENFEEGFVAHGIDEFIELDRLEYTDQFNLYVKLKE